MAKGLGSKLRNRTTARKRSATTRNSYSDPEYTESQQTSLIPLNSIKDRFDGDVRVKKQLSFITQLAGNIAELGLLSPIAIDKKFRLLAGTHRQAAFTLLQKLATSWQGLQVDRKRDNVRAFLSELEPSVHVKNEWVEEALKANVEAFLKNYPDPNSIPAIVHQYDSSIDTERAKFSEAAENNFRQPMSVDDQKNLYFWCLKNGYTKLSGRPRQGQKSLKEAMQLFSGRSARTIQNLFTRIEEEDKAKKSNAPSPAKNQDLAAAKQLKASISSFQTRLGKGEMPDPESLANILPVAIVGLDAIITKLEE